MNSESNQLFRNKMSFNLPLNKNIDRMRSGFETKVCTFVVSEIAEEFFRKLFFRQNVL